VISIGNKTFINSLDLGLGVLALLEKTERQSEFFGNPVNAYAYLSGYCGMSMGYLGDFERGKILFEKGLRYAAQIGDLRSTGLIEFCYGIFFHTKGDWKAAIEHLESDIKYSEKVKFMSPLVWGWAWLGNAYSYLGDPETGRRYVERGLKMQRDAGFEWYLCIYPLFLGDICLHQGDLRNARSFMEEALRLSQKNGEKLMEGVSWILLGRIVGRMETPQIHEAEKYVFQGMKITDGLKLKPYHAQGHLFLAELYIHGAQKEKAMENLKKAETMFREMGMDYWLDETRKVSAEL
jgi:tetratricopeptide (TPR) repeat protein